MEKSCGPYDTRENAQTIKGFETAVAKEHREPTRTNHYGAPKWVSDPTQSVK